MNKKTLYGLAVVVPGGAMACYKYLRSHRQKKIQDSVDKSAPLPVNLDLSVPSDHIHFSISNESNIDLDKCQELEVNAFEADEWKSLVSFVCGESSKALIAGDSFTGLLKCDVPLKDLCKIKGDTGLMRGFIMKDGKISKHASFSEAGLSNATPLLAFQCIAAITSQYFQQIITDRLNVIDTKLDSIIHILTSDDRAKLKVAYNRFVELNKKNTFDIADKQIASEFLGYVEIVREKYKDLLSKIYRFNVDYKWKDKGEAEQKIKALKESRYFEYLEMAMQAESLIFIASAISVKIAKYLGNEEDVNIYSDRMNIDFWFNYIDQFNKVKHDILKYIELQAEKSWFQKKSISSILDEQQKVFDIFEESMLKLQNQFNCNSILYIHIGEDGNVKKYLPLSSCKGK